MNDGVATSGPCRIAIDIGSTVVKVARVGARDEMLAQAFHPRDFAAGIARQVESLLAALGGIDVTGDPLVCSSANGGLRVGIVCLTPHFSGAVLRNQVLAAGSNPVFVRDLEDRTPCLEAVDVLVLGGGIDCPDAGPLAQRLRAFRPGDYRFGSLVYAGNRHLAPIVGERWPEAIVIANPLAESLASRTPTVFEALRRAYLDDLVYKEGVSELGARLARGIRPTPEVVNAGFHRAVLDRSRLRIVGPCLLLDVGGATTDLHYTVEVVRDDSEHRPAAGTSVARYVFTDLGIAASIDSTLLQLRTHPRLHALLGRILERDVDDAYRAIREGEWTPVPQVLAYACVFVALDRFAQGRGPGLPTADLSRLSQLVLTGGAVQGLREEAVASIVELFVPPAAGAPLVQIDRDYRVWVDGITWTGAIPS